MHTKQAQRCLGLLLLCCAGLARGAESPASVFELQKWKLQIPGPQEFKKLHDYSSDYFHLNAAKEMCFCLDAGEKGTTPNAHYVRSELRHLLDWKTGESHSLSAEFRVTAHLTPDKVTALQIHGITAQGDDAPPLLRIAVNNGDLVACLKTDAEGDKTENFPLKKNLGDAFVKVEVAVKNKQLTIAINGEQKLLRSLTYWKFNNYWKAGCYPQAKQGTAEIVFRKLHAD